MGWWLVLIGQGLFLFSSEGRRWMDGLCVCFVEGRSGSLEAFARAYILGWRWE